MAESLYQIMGRHRAEPLPERKPSWLKVRAPGGANYLRLTQMMRDLNLHTVCEEAHCPNIGECWEHGTATFMILGDVRTRNCAYCAVAHGRPPSYDIAEPERVGDAVAELRLRHAVITSVDRDDLPLDQAVRPRIRAGANLSARDYLAVLEDRKRAKLEFDARMSGFDAVLTPSTLTPAVPLDTIDQTKTPAISTRWVNYLDMCALSLPNGMTGNGLPTSLQIVCRGGDEAAALRIGWALEQATDWHMRAPRLD